MLTDLLSGLTNGFGFMAGALLVYTIYDSIFALIEKHYEKAETRKRKRKRH